MIEPAAGVLLIAEPFLKDPNFQRTVVLLCEHNAEGSFGFVLNRLHEYNAGELLTDLEGCDFPVYYGGPVQPNTIHFIHRQPDLISGGLEISAGVFWGGDFNEVVALINAALLDTNDIRFFIGYSGWSEGQLQTEIDEKTWITNPGKSALVFTSNMEALWKDALLDLGGEYKMFTNFPTDPQLN